MPDRGQPCLLALDTATEQMALAVAAADGRAWCQNLPGGALASAQLLPALQALLQQAGHRLADVQAIAYGQGPGAFTGLRTACAVAQGLAFGVDKPVLAIDSLLLVAEDARSQAPDELADGLWWVAMDARMDEAYAALYRHQAGQWQALRPPALYTLPALAAAWLCDPPVRLAGNASTAFGARLPSGSARLWPLQADRAAALLRLALAAWRDGRGQPAEQAMPLYLRDKVALTTAERSLAATGPGRS